MTKVDFFKHIHLDEFSSTPKYIQLANNIIDAIRMDYIKSGEYLPSINEVSFELYISRITVEKAYNYLKDKGVISSIRGKGFFIEVDHYSIDLRVFLLFNKLSLHKKIIYDSFVAALGDYASVDFYIYNNDFKLFKRIIQEREKKDSHIVIIPHFLDGEDQAIALINELPKEKLLLLDKLLPGIEGNFASVYENFEKDIYQALLVAKDALSKYQKLNLIFPHDSFYPKEIRQGFENFCSDYVFKSQIIQDSQQIKLQKGEVYISIMEDDLIVLLDKIHESEFVLGQDVGVISYNETALKRLLANGITTISTDFVEMGKKAAELILQNKKEHVENPFHVNLRASL